MLQSLLKNLGLKFRLSLIKINTYIFNRKQGVKQNAKQMTAVTNKIGNKYRNEASKRTEKVKNDLKKQGKSLNGKDNQVYIGTAKRLWKNAKVERFGYEYIEVNKSRW